MFRIAAAFAVFMAINGTTFVEAKHPHHPVHGHPVHSQQVRSHHSHAHHPSMRSQSFAQRGWQQSSMGFGTSLSFGTHGMANQGRPYAYPYAYPVYGFGYYDDPYASGRFKIPDPLNDPIFRAQHKFDSHFPGRYRSKPRLQLTYPLPSR